jgi:hypothetical protein
MHEIVVQVGLELWEEEDYIRSFYKDFIERFYRWSLDCYRTGERSITFEWDW